MTTAHALAYHHRIYDRLLGELPGDVAGMRAWIKTHKAIDQYLAATVTTGAYRVRPTVAAQAGLLRYEDVDLRDQFVFSPSSVATGTPAMSIAPVEPAADRLQPQPPRLRPVAGADLPTQCGHNGHRARN